MRSNWDKTVALILEWEGPELEVSPDEPGGASKYGVSVAALTDYNKSRGMSAATIGDIEAMTQSGAASFYRWRADVARFDDLPLGVDCRVFDAAVTLGVSGASMIAQLSCGVWHFTGGIDDSTVAACRSADPARLVSALSAAWLMHKYMDGGVEGWVKYGHGWTNRSADITIKSLSMIGGN